MASFIDLPTPLVHKSSQKIIIIKKDQQVVNHEYKIQQLFKNYFWFQIYSSLVIPHNCLGQRNLGQKKEKQKKTHDDCQKTILERRAV